MAVKNAGSIVIRGVLQNVSQAYKNQEFVADRLFPIISGLSPKTKVAKYHKGPWFTDDAEVRGPGAAARISEYSFTTQDITPVNYATAAKVTDEERRDANLPGSVPIKPDMDAMERMANKLDLKREVRASAILHATNWNAIGAGGEDAEGLWGTATAANDTFLADIKKARDLIRKNTGMLPNTLFMDYVCYSALCVAPALISMLYPQSVSANAPLLNEQSLATLARVKEVIVGTAIKTTDEETVAGTEFTAQDVWDPTGKGIAFLYYKPANPGLNTPSPGYQYRLSTDGGFRHITTWYDNATHSTMYDAEESVDISAVGLDLGYMFKDTATT
jgi:hypothetical protein